jgi:hypothetical protein
MARKKSSGRALKITADALPPAKPPPSSPPSPPAPPVPKGTLRADQWAVLVRLYRAGREGIEGLTLMYGPGARGWYPTLARLAHYKPEPLLESEDRGGIARRTYYRLTAFGREYYRREWQNYRTRYPQIPAPRPANPPHAA